LHKNLIKDDMLHNHCDFADFLAKTFATFPLMYKQMRTHTYRCTRMRRIESLQNMSA